MQQIQVAWEILQQKYDALVVSESEVYESLLAQDASEEDLELEMESSDVYRVRFTTMKLRFKKGAHDEEVRSVIQSEQLSTRYQTVYQGFKYTSRVVLTKFVIVRKREMEQTKKHRSVLRSAFTKKANELEQLITVEVKDMQQIQVAWGILQQKYDALVISESEVYESLLAQDASEEDLEFELESSDVYRVRFTTMKLRFKKGGHDEEVRSVLQSEQLSTRYQTGHMSRRCRSRLKCVICGKSHVTLMCADLPSNKITPADQLSGSRDKEGTKTENQVLANHTSAHVFLQTLRVKISSGDRTREVRVLIDSGSQRSYVLKSTVLRMGYVPKRTECIRHCLFGGTQTSEQRHNCYDIKLTQDDYSCTLEALDQPKICNEIPSIFYGAWMEELKTLHIDLHDTLGSDPIEILIGADVAGKLYTGRRHILTCGLVAVETLLGWTLMGRIPSDLPNFSTTLTVHSLFVKDATITKLWEL
ncbi:hypothetical protein JTB14_037540 [Gonioctena quinquepunctata]|nr:hypothetical protein JTB14_037540 [Gonioctena quinquepunctata]